MTGAERREARGGEGYKMEAKLLKKEKNKSIFLFKGLTPYYVNALRRVIIERVPTMAIEDVTFVENSSAMYDEILAHRLGLIVFQADLKSYFVREECKCKGKGCARCELKMTVDVKGPCILYAENIKTKDPKIKPVYPKTPIVKLMKGQAVKLTATAILGRGKDHMKFAPALVYYQGYPLFKIEKCDGCEKCVKQCPKKILEIKNKKVIVTDLLKCDICKACEEACPNKSITVQGSDIDFIVTIEPWGQLSVKEIMSAAIEDLDNQLDSLIEDVKKKV